jgi:hypothetical protein
MDNNNPGIGQCGNQFYSGLVPGKLPELFPNSGYQVNEMPQLAPIPALSAVNQEPRPELPDAPLSQPEAPAPSQSAPQGVQQALEQEQIKPKQKRRSKNEKDGRNYVCGCGKTYLSYPALYTHIKTKHSGQNPSGTQQLQAGRGRGRPRKV